MVVLKKFKIELPKLFSNSTSEYIHRRIENRRPKQTGIHCCFIAVLFTVAERWKQLKCSSTDEWINKMQYIPTMKCYSTKKRETSFDT